LHAARKRQSWSLGSYFGMVSANVPPEQIVASERNAPLNLRFPLHEVKPHVAASSPTLLCAWIGFQGVFRPNISQTFKVEVRTNAPKSGSEGIVSTRWVTT